MSLGTTTIANLTENINVRRQSIRHFSGMIKCISQETERITDAINSYITTSSSCEISSSLYMLSMCIRYIDCLDDEAHVARFLSAVTKIIKKIPRRNEDINYPILWMENTKYQVITTPKQNEQALRNFDLSEYRTIFADLVVHLYDEILKELENNAN
ncbi:unnamed protein product [Rotaria sp. Silwood2]|nr:unnamed protein product [Rotaria sp. Silwood2]CAF4167321.1 unnamed protein product [Rotaria sp. Silwood2]